MAATIAQLLVEVEANTEKAQKGLDAVNEKIGAAPALFKGAAVAVGAFVGAGVAIATVFGAALIYAVKQASDSNVVIAQTNALLKSTHDASGMSAQGIDDLTNHLEELTGVDDDVVRTATNMLLSFTRIGKDVFPQATSSALDLATFLNKGLLPTQEQVQQSSILIGKALNDPIKGMTALQRVGITLSDAQKEQVKHFMAVNDIADAQKVILGELQKETGGAAEAAGNTLPGMLAKLTNAFNDVAKAAGFIFLPVVIQVAGWFASVATTISDHFQKALDAAKPALDALGTAFGDLGQILGEIPMDVFNAFKDLLYRVIAPEVFEGMDKFNPVQFVIQKLADAVGTVTYWLGAFIGGIRDGQGPLASLHDITVLVQQAFDHLGDVVNNIDLSGFLNMLKGIGDTIKDNLSVAIQNIGPKLKDFMNSDFVKRLQDASKTMRDQLGPAIKQLGDWFQNSLMPALRDVAPKFQDLGNTLVTQVVPAVLDIKEKMSELGLWLDIHILPVLEKIIPPLIQFAGVLAQGLSDAIKNVGPHLKDLGNLFQQGGTNLNTIGKALKPVGEFIMNTIVPAVKQWDEKLISFLPKLKDLGTWLQQHIVPVLKDLAQKYQEVQPHIRQFISDVGTRLIPILHNLSNFINNILLPVLGKIGEFFVSQIVPKLKALQLIWNAVWPGIQQTIQTVWGVIQGIITIAWNIITGIIKIGLDILGGNWKQAWTDMQKMFQGVWKGIQEIGQSLFGKLHDFIVDKVTELKVKAYAKFLELKAQASQAISDLKDKIISTLQDLPGKLADIGTKMIDSIVNAIKNGAGRLGDALKQALKDAASHLPGGIHIPGFATGTNDAPPGLAWVGERGRELIALPRGARVYPHQQSELMANPGPSSGSGSGSGVAPVYNVTVYGADANSARDIARQVTRQINWNANLHS